MLTSLVKWEIQHVKGHQDEDPFTEYEDLDRWAQLNVDMDLKAKQCGSDTMTLQLLIRRLLASRGQSG